MATTEAVDLFRSIDRSLKQIVSLLQSQGGGNSAAPMVADDRDLDSQYGDPVVKFNPRDWNGDSCKGHRMSECPAEFLDLLASSFEYFAKKSDEAGATTNSGKPKSAYERKDAARARGWAKRARAGYTNTSTGEIVDPAAGTPPAFEDSASEWPDDSEPGF